MAALRFNTMDSANDELVLLARRVATKAKEQLSKTYERAQAVMPISYYRPWGPAFRRGVAWLRPSPQVVNILFKPERDAVQVFGSRTRAGWLDLQPWQEMMAFVVTDTRLRRHWYEDYFLTWEETEFYMDDAMQMSQIPAEVRAAYVRQLEAALAAPDGLNFDGWLNDEPGQILIVAL